MNEFTYKGETYTHDQVAKKRKVINKNGWQCRIWHWTLGNDVKIPMGYCALFWSSLLFALFSWLTFSVKFAKSSLRFIVAALTPTEEEREEKEKKQKQKRHEQYLDYTKRTIIHSNGGELNFDSAQQLFRSWAPGAVLTEEEFQKLKAEREAARQKQLQLEAAQKLKEEKREARRKYYAEIADKVAKRLQPYTEKLLNFKEFVMRYSKPIVLLVMLTAIGFIGYWSLGLLTAFIGWIGDVFWLIVSNWWEIVKVILLTILTLAAILVVGYIIFYCIPKLKEKIEESNFSFSETKFGQIAQKAIDIVVAIFSAIKTVFGVLCETFTMLYKKECPLIELSDGPTKPIEKREPIDGL